MSPRSAARPDRLQAVAPWILVLAGALVYANAFAGPFVFDDIQTIEANPQIRTLWPPWHFVTDVQSKDVGVSGRPVAGIAFALDYAVHGLSVAGFHAANLAIHVLAGLLIFGILRRTLSLPRMRERFAPFAVAIAFAAALVWIVHPIQTKAVTYMVQRIESLAALLSLLTLYCALRGSTDGSPRRWFPLAVLCCALAMGTKETAVAVPLIVLLHDRAFLSGSFRGAFRARWKLHLALASTWLLLGALVVTSPRIRVAQEAAASVAPIDYAKTQCWAIVHYLGLLVWPGPLVFDYGRAGDGVPLLTRTAQVLPWAVPLLATALVAAIGVWKNRPWGVVCAAFFLVLLPSSSIVPIALEVVAEHRMYLPSAAAIVLAICGLHLALGRVPSLARDPARRATALVLAAAALALPLGARTFARNRDYRSGFTLWSDTVEKRPGSSRAQTSLGIELATRGDFEGAAARHRQALLLRPDCAEIHHNLAQALMGLKQYAAAEAEYRHALELPPDSYETRAGLAEALVQQNRLEEAAQQFERALAMRDDLVEARIRLGAIRESQGKLDEAARRYAEAIRLDPTNVQVLNRYGIVLAQRGELGPAAEQFKRALLIQPGFEPARANLEHLRATQPAGASPPH